MRELIVDSFAGGGGASTGIEMALGRSPDISINHDAKALAMHRINHPGALHLPHNVWKIDPLAVTNGHQVGLLWASPDCKHFSKAKGGKPVKRNIRDLAWVVVRWARQVRPRVIILENVEEFQTWGPLDADNQPCKLRTGETFRQWLAELRKLGYKVEYRELRACDYGAPTIRKRLFLIARCDGDPIVWPVATHGKYSDPDVIVGKKLPWNTAAGIIDWSLPCHSIFLNKEEGRAVGVNRPLAEATMARIAKGVQKYVIEANSPFIVTCNHQGEGFRGQGLASPFNTVAAARDAHGLIMPSIVGCGGRAGQSRPRGGAEPLATVTSKADVCLVTPTLITMGYGERAGQAPRVPHVDVPLHTVVAGGIKGAVVAPVLTYAQQGGAVRDPQAPLHTICASAKDQNALIAAHVTKFSENSTGHLPDEPLHTVMAGAPRHGVVAAFLAQHNSGVVGREAEAPLSTVTATGAQQAVVSAGMVTLNGSKRRGRSVDEPAATVLAGGTHAAEVRAFLIKYYGAGVGQTVAEPMHTVVTKDRYGLVTLDGDDWQIADIGMRMLTPRELFRAQGFPDSYVIDRGMDVETGEIITLTKTEQVRMCGNSVCPPLAHALVKANYQERAVKAEDSDGPMLPLFMQAAE